MVRKLEDTDAPIDIITKEKAPPRERRTGFLPIETNWFDRGFISVVIWVALSLLWFRFMEPAGLSIWISNAIAAALAILIIWRG